MINTYKWYKYLYHAYIYNIYTMECATCSIQFKTKANYAKHLKTERHKKRSSDIYTRTYSCICGKKYAHSQSLYAHRKLCEIYKNTPKESRIHSSSNNVEILMKEMYETIQKKDSQIELLTNQISLLLEKASCSSNTNSHNNTTNNIETQNVIVVNSFGKENTEYLTDQIVSKLIQNGPFTCLPKMIERIHFDPEHPENHNVKFTNHKNKYAKIIKNNKWITANKKQTIDTMIQNSYGLLEDKYNDNKDSISEFKQGRFEDFQEKYNDQDKELMKNIKDQVDIAVINGSDQIHK